MVAGAAVVEAFETATAVTRLEQQQQDEVVLSTTTVTASEKDKKSEAVTKLSAEVGSKTKNTTNVK